MVAATWLALPLQPGDNFGRVVAVMDDVFLIGAPGDGWHTNVTGAGAVYWLSYGERTESQLFDLLDILVAPDPNFAIAGAQFGTSVALADGYIVVGAPKTVTDPLLPKGCFCDVVLYRYLHSDGCVSPTFSKTQRHLISISLICSMTS